MVLQRKYCHDANAGIYKNIYQCLVLNPYKEIIISKVCSEVTIPKKMYVILKAVSIHLKINIVKKWMAKTIDGTPRYMGTESSLYQHCFWPSHT